MKNSRRTFSNNQAVKPWISATCPLSYISPLAFEFSLLFSPSPFISLPSSHNFSHPFIQKPLSLLSLQFPHTCLSTIPFLPNNFVSAHEIDSFQLGFSDFLLRSTYENSVLPSCSRSAWWLRSWKITVRAENRSFVDRLQIMASARNDQASAPQLTRRASRSAAMTTFSMEVFDNEVVPSSLQSIAPILRVAAEIQNERPRVAYLCTFVTIIELRLIRMIKLVE